MFKSVPILTLWALLAACTPGSAPEPAVDPAPAADAPAADPPAAEPATETPAAPSAEAVDEPVVDSAAEPPADEPAVGSPDQPTADAPAESPAEPTAEPPAEPTADASAPPTPASPTSSGSKKKLACDGIDSALSALVSADDYAAAAKNKGIVLVDGRARVVAELTAEDADLEGPVEEELRNGTNAQVLVAPDAICALAATASVKRVRKAQLVSPK